MGHFASIDSSTVVCRCLGESARLAQPGASTGARRVRLPTGPESLLRRSPNPEDAADAANRFGFPPATTTRLGAACTTSPRADGSARLPLSVLDQPADEGMKAVRWRHRSSPSASRASAPVPSAGASTPASFGGIAGESAAMAGDEKHGREASASISAGISRTVKARTSRSLRVCCSICPCTLGELLTTSSTLPRASSSTLRPYTHEFFTVNSLGTAFAPTECRPRPASSVA